MEVCAICVIKTFNEAQPIDPPVLPISTCCGCLEDMFEEMGFSSDLQMREVIESPCQCVKISLRVLFLLSCVLQKMSCKLDHCVRLDVS
jgi:hypothetical protein